MVIEHDKNPSNKNDINQLKDSYTETIKDC